VRRRAGTRVTVCIATDGRHSARSRVVGAPALAELRTTEARTACARLGVAHEDVRFLGYEDGTLADRRDELVVRIRELLDELDPDDLLVPTNIDWHPDHRMLFSASVEAAALSTPVPRLLAYPVWFWSRASWLDPGSGRLRRIGQGVGRPLLAAVRLRPRTVSTE